MRLSRSQAVTYTVNMVTSRKQYKLASKTLLLQATNRKVLPVQKSAISDNIERHSKLLTYYETF